MFSRGVTAVRLFSAYLGKLQPRKKMYVWHLMVYIYITKQKHYSVNMCNTFILSYQSGMIKVGWIRDGGTKQHSIDHT